MPTRFLSTRSLNKKILGIASKHIRLNILSIVKNKFNRLSLILMFSLGLYFVIKTNPILNLYFSFFNIFVSYISMIFEIIKVNPFLLILIPWVLSYVKSSLKTYILSKIYLVSNSLYLYIVSRFSKPNHLFIIYIIDRSWFIYNLLQSYYIKYRKALYNIILFCNLAILFYQYMLNNITLNEITEFFLFIFAIYNIYNSFFNGVSYSKNSVLSFLFLSCNIIVLIFCWHSFINVILHIITFIRKFSGNDPTNQAGPSNSGPNHPNNPQEPGNITSEDPKGKKRIMLRNDEALIEGLEKIEDQRKRKNEAERLRKKRIKANMTEEERKAYNAKNKEYRRTKDIFKPELEKTAERIVFREYQQKYRANRTEEQKIAANEKERLRRLNMRENMTEEELSAYHAKDSQAAVARRADDKLIKATRLELDGGQGLHNKIYDKETEHNLDLAVANELNRKYLEEINKSNND